MIPPVVWICILLMLNDFELLYIYFLAIHGSSLEKDLFNALSYFLVILFVVVSGVLYIVDINPLLNVCFANIFYCSICFFPLLIISFACRCYYLERVVGRITHGQ